MNFTSINWKVISATRDSIPKSMKTATIESDNHADTWCFGPNFFMDNFTG